MHIFGHTHFGWDTVLNGTRYVQDSGAMVAVCASTLVNIAGYAWNRIEHVGMLEFTLIPI